MNIFFDTSSLFKLYHREADTVIIEQIFSRGIVTNVYLSEITKVEFASSVWKKVRTREITELEATATLQLFERDSDKYTFIAFISPSGDGLKVIIKIPANIVTHANSCKSLKQYYKNDPKIAEELTSHIMNNREEKMNETIQRKINKII